MKKSQGENPTLPEIEPPLEWFQWEFLRRNEQYQRDYGWFDSQFGAWFKEHGYWWAKTGPAYNPEDLFFLSSVIGPVARAICKRWGISAPYDPTWTFEAGGTRLEQGSWVGLPVFSDDAENLGIWNCGELDPALFPSEEARINELLKDIPEMIEEGSWRVTHDKRLIRIEIDITQPLELILRQVKQRVERKRPEFPSGMSLVPSPTMRS